MGATGLAIWPGAGACAGDRPGSGARALHADELTGEPREPADQQPHGSCDQHARLQGDQRSFERVARSRRESIAPHQFSLRSSNAAERGGSRTQVEATGLHLSGKWSSAIADEEMTRGELNGSTDSSR